MLVNVASLTGASSTMAGPCHRYACRASDMAKCCAARTPTNVSRLTARAPFACAHNSMATRYGSSAHMTFPSIHCRPLHVHVNDRAAGSTVTLPVRRWFDRVNVV